MDNYVKKLESETINNNPQILEYLEDIDRPTAERAFRNTSFSPEKRGKHVRMEYAENLLLDRAQALNEIGKASQRGASLEQGHLSMVDGWFQSHRKKLADLYTAWLHSHARTASSFITGPSNFPLARNEKLSRYAHAKLLAIDEFRQSSIKRLLKSALPHGDGVSIQIDDPEAYDKIEKKIATLEKQREDMKAINKAIRKYLKNEGIDGPLGLAEFKGLLRTEFNVDEAQIIEAIGENGNLVSFKAWQLQNLGANITRYKKSDSVASS